MASLEVTCITKRGNHLDPHERIQALGGPSWYHTEDDAISNIERGIHMYYAACAGALATVTVATNHGRKYLKTTADDDSPDNLLALPECQQ